MIIFGEFPEYISFKQAVFKNNKVRFCQFFSLFRIITFKTSNITLVGNQIILLIIVSRALSYYYLTFPVTIINDKGFTIRQYTRNWCFIARQRKKKKNQNGWQAEILYNLNEDNLFHLFSCYNQIFFLFKENCYYTLHI